MRYVSTRASDHTSAIPFCDAVLTGLAADGGLLVPATIPDVSNRLDAWRGLSFQELALEVMSLFIDDIPRDQLEDLITRSYATFAHPDVTPLRPLRSPAGTSNERFVLELFHGPTLAFKDVALQFLGNLFDYILNERDQHMNILAATSGDTGSAAIAGVRGKERINIFVMFPNGGTSRLQALQMTSVLDDNVFNIALDGSFDDCQAIMKNTFGDLAFKEKYALGAVNSVNWARVLAQIVYYFYAGLRMGARADRPVNFSVPTGNFGNIFAGFMAQRMGLPVGKLILATNENDILARFFRTGRYERGAVNKTLSPSMDIQVASNFERFLHLHLDRDAQRLCAFMADFADTGAAKIATRPGNWPSLDDFIVATSVDTNRTLRAIKSTYEREGYVLDPHSAVGVAALEDYAITGPVAALATAHPAKFPEAIGQVIDPALATHPALTALEGLPTRCAELPNDIDVVKAYVAEHSETG